MEISPNFKANVTNILKLLSLREDKSSQDHSPEF